MCDVIYGEEPVSSELDRKEKRKKKKKKKKKSQRETEGEGKGEKVVYVMCNSLLL